MWSAAAKELDKCYALLSVAAAEEKQEILSSNKMLVSCFFLDLDFTVSSFFAAAAALYVLCMYIKCRKSDIFSSIHEF